MSAPLTRPLRLARTISSLGCAALLALALPAAAENRLPAAARSIPPLYDWSGLYFGGHVGYSRGEAQSTLTDLDMAPDSFASSFGSLTGGIQAGYNYVSPRAFFLASKQTQHS
jgi:high affinity Mn2+ porin